jgi:hypothetical protein
VNLTPAEIAAGTIDWRFADPSADTLVGFRARRIAAESNRSWDKQLRPTRWVNI